MPHKKYCFFLRVHNDTDHLCPVIWKFLKEGYVVEVILLDKNLTLDLGSDPRLCYLKKFPGCRMRYYYSLCPGLGFLANFSFARFRNPVLKKISRQLTGFLSWFVFNLRWAENFISSLKPAACVFDPCESSLDTIEGKLIRACQKFSVPLVCLPHGVHYITSYGEKSEQFKKASGGELFAPHDVFDVLVETSPYHLFYWDKRLVESGKIVLLGSARYCAEWFGIARNFWPDFKPAKNDSGRLRLVFFLPRWEKTVDKVKTLEAIERFAADPRIFLAIKEHTREGAGGIPESLRERLAHADNVEFVSGSSTLSMRQWCLYKKVVDSVALIRWSDAVVNFRSSIGFEAVVQNKTLVNPVYLHSNKTIFEESGTGITCRSLEELMRAVDFCLRTESKNFIPYDSTELIRQAVYAGKAPHDVLAGYVRLITEYKTNSGLKEVEIEK